MKLRTLARRTSMNKLQRLLYIFGSNELDTAIHNEDWKKVELICSTRPKEAKRWSNQGTFDGKHSSKVLPLHSALLARPPPSVIQALLDAYPKAVYIKETGFSRLPVHLSCRAGGSVDVLRILLKFNPSGSLEKDVLGRAPLHYAISNGAELAVVNELLSISANSAAVTDNKGWLPIHVACDCGASYEVIKQLLIAYPDAVHMKTENHNTPLTLFRRSKTADHARIIELLNNPIGQDGGFHA